METASGCRFSQVYWPLCKTDGNLKRWQATTITMYNHDERSQL